MFLQVKVPDMECKFLQFLWRDNPTKPVAFLEYTGIVVGAKTSPTCAKYGLEQIGRDIKDDYPLASKAIAGNFYMDDFAKSVEIKKEAIEFCKQLKVSLMKESFSLTKWISNNGHVMNSFHEIYRAE